MLQKQPTLPDKRIDGMRTQWEHERMPRRRFAIITFDPDRIEQIETNADGQTFAWIMLRALQGYEYPKERGIINITLMDQLPKRER